MVAPERVYELICGHKKTFGDDSIGMSVRLPYKTGFVTGEGAYGSGPCTVEGTISLEGRILSVDLDLFSEDRHIHFTLAGEEHAELQECYRLIGEADVQQSSTRKSEGVCYAHDLIIPNP